MIKPSRATPVNHPQPKSFNRPNFKRVVETSVIDYDSELSIS
jgi:hypothetical protein